MTALEWLRQPAAQRLALVLLYFLWQGAAVAAVTAAALTLFRRSRPQSRYALLLAALLAMAVCPCATFLLIEPPTQPAALVVTPAPRDAVMRPAVSFSEAPAAPVGLSERFRRAAAIAGPYCVAFWLLGVLLFGGRLLLGLAAVPWMGRRREAAPAWLRDAADRLAGRLRLRRVPRVATGQRLAEAMAVGFLRPLVLFPAAWLAELPPSVLEAVLAHELAHIRRRDVWVNLAQRVVETLLFYHPAVWWLSRRLRLERELCCDDLAVAALGAPLEYAQALACIAGRRLIEERGGSRDSLLVATGIGGRKMPLLRRVNHVLRPTPPDGGGPTAARWSAGLIALALPPALWLGATMLPPPAVGDDADRTTLLDDRDDDDADRDERRAVRDDDDRDDADRPRRDQDARRDRDRGDREVEGRREGEDRGRRDRPPMPMMRPPGPPPFRDGDRPRFDDRDDRPPIERLLREMRQLREEVERLRHEVRDLREHRGPGGPPPPPPPPRFDREDRDRRDGDRPRPEGDRRDRPRGEERPREREGDRPRRESPEAARDAAEESPPQVTEDALRRARDMAEQARKEAEAQRQRAELALKEAALLRLKSIGIAKAAEERALEAEARAREAVESARRDVEQRRSEAGFRNEGDDSDAKPETETAR